MCWLSYAEDEVTRFHPEFESAANEALQEMGLHHDYEWVHHKRSPGTPLVPDFVLRRTDTNRWVTAFEIKRSREAVYSTRNQIQAKSYAESNQDLYAPNAPKYFAISNLETTILFALSDGRPPRECRLRDAQFWSGNFSSDERANHRRQFIDDMKGVVRIVTEVMRPTFDSVWPGVLSDFVSYANDLPRIPAIKISEPATRSWALVRDYFGSPLLEDSARVFILRCLMAEYLRGILLRYGHRRAGQIPPLRTSQACASLANAIEALRRIDFLTMFEAAAVSMYRDLDDPAVRDYLRQYVSLITDPSRKVVELARSRIDYSELLDSLMTALYPVEIQDELGKVTTDPELAAVLAHLTISSRVDCVLDPCCGNGVLLSAAYDRLVNLGMDHDAALAAVAGIEADSITARLACIRLALKQPSILSSQPEISIHYGDMFTSSEDLAAADAILMNPPFKRYEAQDRRPVPRALREHYAQAIQAIDGIPPRTTGGQANLFNFYVEFAASAIPVGARIGVILDNKWYHNNYCKALRQFMLQHFEIEGIIEYPHSAFFSHWTIATSIVIARKVTAVNPDHAVKFIRSKVDPRGVDLNALADAFFDAAETWPPDWTCQTKLQTELDAKVGWKRYFSHELTNDFRREDWPVLQTLFGRSRRGSLQKEGGGIGILEFPFHRPNYGPRRQATTPRRRYQTERDRRLTRAENERLATLADQIPPEFRGWALRRADDPEHYELSITDVEKQQTLEPPRLRAQYNMFLQNRTPWTRHHDIALADMRRQPEVAAFIQEIENTVNLTENVLSRDELWNVLREPIAGELIIPRKTRSGHRAHINPFALNPHGRQVRVSSNFISFGDCIAQEPDSDLDRATAVRLIGAFLVSSFGQLQFEVEGYNREGLLALEKGQLDHMRIFDPRWVRPQSRQTILNAFAQLPYPIPTDRLSSGQSERNQLDKLFAHEIATRFTVFDAQTLLEEVHNALDEWLIARQP